MGEDRDLCVTRNYKDEGNSETKQSERKIDSWTMFISNRYHQVHEEKEATYKGVKWSMRRQQIGQQ
jgi:hypothetical protein